MKADTTNKYASSAEPSLLETLLDISLTGVILFEPIFDLERQLVDLAYLRLNPAAQQMLSLPMRPEQTFLTLYPHTIETGIFAFYRDTFLSGAPGNYRVNYSHDGLDNYFHLAAQCSGSVLVVSFTDTSGQDRSEVEVSLRRSQAFEQKARSEAQQDVARLERLLAQTPVAIAIFQGPAFVIELANPTVLSLWGRSAEQAIGTPLFDLLPEIVGQGIEELLSGVMSTGKPYAASELPTPIDRYGRRDTVYWNFVYQPWRNEQGEITGVMVIATEVTEQVMARQEVQSLNEEMLSGNEELRATNEELFEARQVMEQFIRELDDRVQERTRELHQLSGQLARANDELTVANEEIRANNEELSEVNAQLMRTNVDLDNFIYTASHDLKAPIANIEGLLQVLLKLLSDQGEPALPTRRVTNLIGVSIERFKRTIESLTEVVKLQKENDPELSLVALGEVIGEVCLDLHPLIESSGAQIVVSDEGCELVRFSAKNLRSVVYNLVSNALKYRSEHRIAQIRLHCQQSEAYVILSVEDNGMGMSLSKDSKLFSMFKRLHSHVEGSGIGLYMIKRMVENVGGRIEVESQVGIGSTFRVYFPR